MQNTGRLPDDFKGVTGAQIHSAQLIMNQLNNLSDKLLERSAPMQVQRMKDKNKDIYDSAEQKAAKIHDLQHERCGEFFKNCPAEKLKDRMWVHQNLIRINQQVIREREEYFEKTGCWDEDEYRIKYGKDSEMEVENAKKRKAEGDLPK
jgi:hypothetical protein